MNEARRRAFNYERLLKVDTTIRPQVRSVLGTLEHYGWRPIVGAEVWRDPALQRELKRKGLSRLSWGFHCATRGGKPASLAADIFDVERVQNPTRDFLVCIGYAATAQGLGWGGWWLPKSLHKGIHEAFKQVRAREDVPESLKLGWDSPHVETARVTVAEARAGKR